MENDRIDIYQDGKFDINFLEDLLSLDFNNSDNVNILGKDDNTISFRLGLDFFKLNFNNNSLQQFADYKSLYENKDFKLIYSENQPYQNNDFGKAIVESFDLNEIKNRQNKELGKRTEFLVNKPELSYASPEKRLQLKDKLSNELKKTLPQQELKPVTDLFDVLLTVAVMMFLFKLKFNKKNEENENIINEIFKGLDDNSLSLDSLYKDKYLNEKLPGLKKLLDLYRDNHLVDFKLMVGSDEVGKQTVVNDNPLLITDTVRKATLFLENNVKDTKMIGYNPEFGKNNTLETMFPDISNTKSFKQAKSFIENDSDKTKYHNYSDKEIGVTGLLMAALFSNYNGDESMEQGCIKKAVSFSHSNNLELGKIFNLFNSMKGQIEKGIILGKSDVEKISSSNSVKFKR